MLTLIPFSETDANLRLEVALAREANLLSVVFVVTGEIWDLCIQEPEEKPGRQDELWKTTCFELFFGIHGSENYREINLSPCGNWNTYSFARYREEMKIEKSLTPKSFQFKREDEKISLSASFDLSQLVSPDQRIDLSAAAVLEDDEKNISYWAIKHSGKKPDFHLRDSFIFEL